MRILVLFSLLSFGNAFTQVNVDSFIDNYSSSYNYIQVTLDKSAFELNTEESLGFCWSNQPNPSIRDGIITDTSQLNYVVLKSSSLKPNTRYYVRLFLLTPEKTIYGRSFETVTAASPEGLQVGDYYQGGLISHLFKAGEKGYVEGEKHGIIVTEKDVASSQWGCYSVHTGSDTKNKIGFGATNTQGIIAFHHNDLIDFTTFPEQCHPTNDGSIAAYICDTLNCNGYSDWFLPSIEEMYTVRLNLHEKGKGNLSSLPNIYWSSTEEKPKVWIFQRGAIYAYAVQMESGIIGIGTKKNTQAKIRAVRYF